MYGIFTGGDYQKSTIRLSRHMKLVPHSGPIPLLLPDDFTIPFNLQKISLTFTIQATKKSNYLSNNPFSVGTLGKHTYLLDFTSLCRYKWPNTPLKLNNGCAHWWILAIQFPLYPALGIISPSFVGCDLDVLFQYPSHSLDSFLVLSIPFQPNRKD